MGNSIHKLTKKQVEAYKVPGRYNDGGGLYLHVRKGGTKTWIYRFRQNGKLHEMSLGPLNAANDLMDARKRASDARVLTRQGDSPLAQKRSVQITKERKRTTERKFVEILEEFFLSKDRTGFFTSERTRKRWRYCLYHHAKKLHSQPISEIETPDVYKVLEPIWATKTETASRTRLYVEAVMSWAKTMGYRAGENPAIWRGNLDQLLTAKDRVSPVRHHPGMRWQEIPEFFRDLKALEMPAARLLEFIILTAARSGEARGAIWSEIDAERNVWEIPKERMKMRRPHLVPIQGRTLEILHEARAFRLNDKVFPNLRTGKEFSYNAPMVVLKKLGRENITVHGFRSSFKTWALESTNFPTQAIEFALAHETKNSVEGAYIRGDRMLEKRRSAMASWNDYCCSLL